MTTEKKQVVNDDAADAVLVASCLDAIGVECWHDTLTDNYHLLVDGRVHNYERDVLCDIYATIQQSVIVLGVDAKGDKVRKPFKMPMQRYQDAVIALCRKMERNIAREYIDKLPLLDCMPKLPNGFADIFVLDHELVGVDADAYAQYCHTVFWEMFCALYSRMREAGSRYDRLPVLVGKQGVGKSTFAQGLSIKKTTFNKINLSLTREEILVQRRACLVSEAEELNLTRRDVGLIKSLITDPKPSYRRKYARDTTTQPLTDIMIGTTNNEMFTAWDDENRRIAPINIKDCKPEFADGRVLTYCQENLAQWLTFAKYMVETKQEVILKPSDTWAKAYGQARYVEHSKREMLDVAIDEALTVAKSRSQRWQGRLYFRGITARTAYTKEFPYTHGVFSDRELGRAARERGLESKNIKIKGKQVRVYIEKAKHLTLVPNDHGDVLASFEAEDTDSPLH